MWGGASFASIVYFFIIILIMSIQQNIEETKRSIKNALSKRGRFPEKGSNTDAWISFWTTEKCSITQDIIYLDIIIKECERQKAFKEERSVELDDYIVNPQNGIRSEITKLKSRNEQRKKFQKKTQSEE
jgi:hypothetical protein